METPNSGSWSELPMDILRFLLEHLCFIDFHRAKMVCRNWYLCSKQTVRRRSGSPLLIPSSEDDCVLFNPEEYRVNKSTRDLSGTRFLANSGNWFLALDSGSNLYIEHAFSEKKRINLPPLESIKSDLFSLKRVGEKEFNEAVGGFPEKGFSQRVKDLRGLLWVDERKEEYTVAWFFDKGFMQVTNRSFILPFLPAFPPSSEEITYAGRLKVNYNIAVTRSGEVLLVKCMVFKATTSAMMPKRMFHLYKTDPNTDSEDILHRENLSFEVLSLGDEALLLDSGITVPADPTLGIEPNSIYFTRHDRVRNYVQEPSCPDICVFHLATKKFTRFPILSYFNPKDALWFLPC
uniref:F-box domain-containing protein n=1 Tax=Brassica oleracea TaxID=3712 RepID=A0A3P6CCJ6_BRAOL|nr:unnamed protein product [Brassica oleracea]